VSDLLSVRVIAEPPAAAGAVGRLAEVFDLDRRDGPYPSRKTPELVRYYLTGRERPVTVASGEWLCAALEHVREGIAAALSSETADRQYALEQADGSLAVLIERWHASASRAAAPAREEAGR
jgi:hypothetical protein